MSVASGGGIKQNERYKGNPEALKPEGLEAINSACLKLYPDQPNPLQVTALVKYWLGGPDPLDYITIYHNNGGPDAATPPHWHYITCGFSDLHGDGRVHKRVSSPEQPSGLGFELSFRLLSETMAPPTWPAELLQSLARYVFSSNNTLCVGDHISWHAPLAPHHQGSHICHMLLAPDPQLHGNHQTSSLGTLHFIQVVGITSEELAAAQKWNGLGLLRLMRSCDPCGGELLVTDVKRRRSLFELMPEAGGQVDEGVEVEGSLLSGVSALCWWESSGCGDNSTTPIISPAGTTELDPELRQTISLENVHLKFNLEATSLLPLAIRGRLNHGRHFTFKSLHGDVAITLVTHGVEGAFATDLCPLASHGPWLQVYLGKEENDKILQDITALLNQSGGHNKLERSLPLSIEWSELHIKISVCP